MPIRALPGSPGYMFASWPAAPPVFEAVARPSRLCVPMPIRATRPTVPSPATEPPTVAAGAPLAGPVEGEAATLAPMPGRALGPCAATLTSGRSVSGIEFEPSPEAEPDFLWTPFDDARALGRLQQGDEPKDLVEFIERLRAAGVNANRHASPDLLAQLHQAVRRPIDTVVCAALDTDPSACLNAAMVAWYGIELAAGMLLLSRVSRAGRAVVAVDARVPSSWLASLRSAGRSSSLRVEPMVNDYPQADPTLMLYTLLNRRLRPGRLPSELGVIQVDATTAVAVGRCALVGGPVLSWPLVVRDHVLRQSFFLFAPGGMRLGDVLEQSRVSPASVLARGGDVLRDVRLPPGAVVG